MVAGETGFQAGKFLEAGLVAAGLAGLTLQGADLALDLADDVGEADEIGLGVLQLPERFLFLTLVLGDAGGLFENGATVFGAGGEDRIDLPLFHDGVGGATDAGIHEHVLDIAQTARRLVQLVLAGAVAEDAAGNHDLVVGGAHFRLAIAERQGDLGHAERGAGIGAGKDDVLHLTTAQGFGRLLAEDPANRVENVALTAAIRADDGGDALVEFKRGAIRERLKTDDVERLQVHPAFLARAGRA